MKKRRPLPRLPRAETLVSRTEQVLRDAIARGDFSGNRLPTSVELAEQLGVSRETVRLAQEALQREGLIVKYRRKGTLLQAPPLALRGRTARPALLGYLQADYPSPHGGDEAVTRASAGLMLQGASHEAGRAGHDLVVRHVPHTEMDGAIDRLLEGSRVRGVVFASFGEEKQVRKTLALGLPAVLLDHELNVPRLPTVREDSFQGARLAVEHLASLGHRRIAFASWRLGDLNPWKLRGYRKGLREARLPARRAWELSGEISALGAVRLAERLAALQPRPTAVFCFNNSLARLLIGALRVRRLRVPEDFSIMGAGGEEVAGLAYPQADWFAMGRAAVRILLRTIAAGREPAPEHRLFPYTLRTGRTAAPPR